MKSILYSPLFAVAALSALSACEKDNISWDSIDEGSLNCRSLSVDYINSNRLVRAADVNVGDFIVNFVDADTREVKRSFKYSEMPEVVTLPVGNYDAEAVFGDNPVAAWDAPYYLGKSGFSIQPGKITDDVAPVECALSNMRIAVNVDDLGLGLLEDDVKVEVKAGAEGALTYDKSTNDKSGYFRYVTNSNTITATFSGTVDGVYVDGISKAYDNAEAGNAYTINFTVKKPDNTEPGGVQVGDGEGYGGITIDATITIKDENKVVNPYDDPCDDLVTDDMRPVESDDDPGSDDPGSDDPGTDDPASQPAGPQIIMMGDLKENECITADEGSKIKFKVTSETGITGFLINIDSTTLKPADLTGVGLAADIDLINPGDLAEPLHNLGFPVGDEVKNKTEVAFDISGFIVLMKMLGPGEHKFHLTVTDDSGTTEGLVWFKTL